MRLLGISDGTGASGATVALVLSKDGFALESKSDILVSDVYTDRGAVGLFVFLFESVSRAVFPRIGTPGTPCSLIIQVDCENLIKIRPRMRQQ